MATTGSGTPWNFDGTRREPETDADMLADEIAHDLVSPPDDDAGDATVAAVLRLVEVARAAALATLRSGADVDTASEAAECALDNAAEGR